LRARPFGAERVRRGRNARIRNRRRRGRRGAPAQKSETGRGAADQVSESEASDGSAAAAGPTRNARRSIRSTVCADSGAGSLGSTLAHRTHGSRIYQRLTHSQMN